MQELLNNGATSSVPLGSIKDMRDYTLLKMWKTEVPSGKLLFQRHSHISFEITIVNSGKGVYTIKEKEYPIEAGDVFVFSSNEFHCITDVGAGGLKLTNLHFEPRYLWGGHSSNLNDENINLCFYHSKSFQNRIPADKAGKIYNLVSSIETEFIAQGEEYALAVKSFVNLILIELVRGFNYLEKTAPISQMHTKNLRHILSFIDEHFAEKITLEELGNLAGMSPNYFSAFFKKVSGINLWDYINSKRVDAAARMIRDRNDDKNMLEIAVLSGFNNTTNFNKIFKRMTGMTPSEYKKNTSFMIH